MKRLIAALVFAVSPGAAFAENCGQWRAAMEDTEGGRVMTAEVCSSSPNANHILSTTCSGTDYFFRWFVPDDTPDFPPGGGEEFQTRVVIGVEGQTQQLDAQFSPMDGAMEIQLARKSAVAKALKSGSAVTLKAESQALPSASFSLAGSSKALARLEATCAR